MAFKFATQLAEATGFPGAKANINSLYGRYEPSLSSISDSAKIVACWLLSVDNGYSLLWVGRRLFCVSPEHIVLCISIAYCPRTYDHRVFSEVCCDPLHHLLTLGYLFPYTYHCDFSLQVTTPSSAQHLRQPLLQSHHIIKIYHRLRMPNTRRSLLDPS